MLRWVLNRRALATVASLVAVVALMALTADERQRITQVESLVLDALSPVTRAVHAALTAVEETGQRVAELARLREENERLRQELAAYRRQEALFDRVIRSHTRLRALLNLKERVPETVTAASVIGRDPDRWLEQVVLDVGSADGVAVDMVAIESRGVVGRVVRVTRYTSTVMLLTDPQSGIGVTVARSGDAGVAAGDPRRPGQLTVRWFSRDPDVRVGDRIVTSGFGAVYPPDLPVGEVVAVETDDLGLARVAVVQPAVDFDRLHEVLIVRPVQRREGAE